MLIVGQFVIRAPCRQRLVRLFSGQNPREDRVVRPLYASEIHESRRTANEGPPRKDQSRNRLPTPGGNDARAVGYPFAPDKSLASQWMGLETLKLVEWGERRVLIVEMHDKSDRD